MDGSLYQYAHIRVEDAVGLDLAGLPHLAPQVLRNFFIKDFYCILYLKILKFEQNLEVICSPFDRAVEGFTAVYLVRVDIHTGAA